jgi:hypothetical protein
MTDSAGRAAVMGSAWRWTSFQPPCPVSASTVEPMTQPKAAGMSRPVGCCVPHLVRCHPDSVAFGAERVAEGGLWSDASAIAPLTKTTPLLGDLTARIAPAVFCELVPFFARPSHASPDQLSAHAAPPRSIVPASALGDHLQFVRRRSLTCSNRFHGRLRGSALQPG